MAEKRIAYTHTGYTNLDDATSKDSFSKNQYLMAMIFSHLQVENDKTSLLNAALTSKDFLEVALDRLWESMASFLPVLNLLPALEFENNTYYVSANVHVFL